MYRKLILAGAMVAAFSAPAFAEWNVLKPTAAVSGPENVCMVVERVAAVAGETMIAGPFATEAEAKTAADSAPACKNEGTSNAGESTGSSPAPN